MRTAYPATIRSTCPYCGVGCGVAVTLTADGVDLGFGEQWSSQLS